MRNNKIDKISDVLVKKMLKINNERHWKRIAQKFTIERLHDANTTKKKKTTQNLNYSNECMEKIKI